MYEGSYDGKDSPHGQDVVEVCDYIVGVVQDDV